MTQFSTARSRRSTLLPDGAVQVIWRRIGEIGGLAMMIFGCALVLAYLSYNPTDPSPLIAAGGKTRNLLGRFGAATTDVGIRTLGLAYLALIGIVVFWGWRLFAHHGLKRIWLRLTILPPALTFAALALGSLPIGMAALPAGPGGAIGQLVLNLVRPLGPVLGGMGQGGIGLAAACLAGASLFWCLGFNPDEWRLTTPKGNGWARKGADLGAGIAEFGRDLARRGAALREPRFEAEGDEATAQLAGPRTSVLGGLSADDRPSVSSGPLAIPSAKAARRTRTKQEREIREPSLDLGAPSAPRDASAAAVPVEQRTDAARSPARSPAKPLELQADASYALPSHELLAEPPPNRGPLIDEETLQENARLLEGVLQDFGVRGEIVKVRPGPVVTLYELEPAPGTKSSRVIGLADDIARSMSAIAVRIAVVPGRSVIGIELPNARRETVFLREMLAAADYEQTASKLALILGKDIGGAPVVTDLARMPHLLIAGTTGSGKSVGINTMILSLLYRLPPDKCRFIMIDPKMLELSVYDGIPHLLAPVVTDPKKAVVALKWAVREMETRYRAMSKLSVRNIEGYNARVADITKNGSQTTRQVQVGFDEVTGAPLFEEQPLNLEFLPYIVVVVDEMADLMLVAGKEIEGAIQRLAQMARAAGIHLIMATQRPSVDVITGTIKANFPTRISFQVTSKIDSRTILGEAGAEQLLGQGDMLYMAGGGRVTRVHGPFVADSEVEAVVSFLKSQGEPVYLDAVTEDDESAGRGGEGGELEGDGEGSGDGLFDQAVALVARERKASTSFIQRHLQIGYNRAARLIERMETEGMVSAANHVGKREVLLPRSGNEN